MGKGSQLQMVVAEEEEGVPPLAGERWGKAQVVMTPKRENLRVSEMESFLCEAVAGRAGHQGSKLPKLTNILQR